MVVAAGAWGAEAAALIAVAGPPAVPGPVTAREAAAHCAAVLTATGADMTRPPGLAERAALGPDSPPEALEAAALEFLDWAARARAEADRPAAEAAHARWEAEALGRASWPATPPPGPHAAEAAAREVKRTAALARLIVAWGPPWADRAEATGAAVRLLSGDREAAAAWGRVLDALTAPEADALSLDDRAVAALAAWHDWPEARAAERWAATAHPDRAPWHRLAALPDDALTH